MANFLEFIRYGLPGYIFLSSLVFALYQSHMLPPDRQFYSDYGTIIGACLLVVGPLVGFVIHQIYFIYFDSKESYTSLKRGCLNILYDNYVEKQKINIATEEQLAKACYVTWKFLMTGMDENFKISSTFLNRLTSLRNYSHSFGGIITSSLFSVIVYFYIIISTNHDMDLKDNIFVFIQLCLLILFMYKRREINTRIDEFERGIMVIRLNEFVHYLETLINQRLNFDPTYKITSESESEIKKPERLTVPNQITKN